MGGVKPDEGVREMKCVSCGGTNVVEGTVPLTPKDDFKFNPGGRSFKDRVFGGGRKARAYGRMNRNYLQPAVGFDPSDVERYREFEGVPPIIVERPGRSGRRQG